MSVSVFKRGNFRPGRSDGARFMGDISRSGPQGQALNIKVSSILVPMTGGLITVTATGARLAKKLIVGVTGRVTKVLVGAGLTTFSVGDGSDADRYGAALVKTLGTTFDFSTSTADPREWLAAAGNIVFTGAAGIFTSGEIRLDIHYIDLTAPAS
jgi:hypothetical protein